MHAPAARVETLARDLPAGLADLVDDCLKKDVAERPPSLEDVSLRLQTILRRGSSSASRWVVAAMVAVLALTGVLYWQSSPPAPAGSVAVIPFATTEAPPDGPQLVEELSGGIINALTRLPDLKVIARTSSFQFRGDALNIPQVARALGVKALVTGRVVAAGGRLTIGGELVVGSDGTGFWHRE